MKKKLISIILIFGLILTMSSCISLLFSTNVKLVVDKNNPAEDNATITFNGMFWVLQWNDIDILKDLYGTRGATASSNAKASLTVPSGTNKFTFTVFYYLGNVTYKYENIDMQYDLRPGRKYQVTAKHNYVGFTKVEFFVRLHDVTERKSELLREWKLGER